MLRIGHRGACGYAPENTLLSIQKALELNVHGVEIDVRCINGKLILIHDDTLDRTTNGHGLVKDYSFEELRKLDAGKGEKIPLLEEVLELVDGKVLINIELKGGQLVEQLTTTLKGFLESGYPPDALLISSFNHRELISFKSHLPNIPLGALTYGVPYDLAQAGSALGAYSIHIGREYVTTELLADARKRRLQVFVYTINEPRDMTIMEALGVDGIFSDYPDR